VKTKDGDLYTIPCEAIFNQHHLVKRSALVGVGPAGDQTPVICIELEKTVNRQTEPLDATLLRLGAAHPHTAGITRVLYHESFPVDIRHNAKIFREKLAVWAAQELAK
jgi:hypothetical protein